MKDHLGSIYRLVGEDGTPITDALFSFDPYGRMRNPLNWSDYSESNLNLPEFNILGRGFTGHEHMPEFGLINMNGRVYDQKLGQFIQPDNFIQSPGFSQSFNRFGYCNNNPVNLTDPSGECIIPIIAAAITIYCISVRTYENWQNYGREAGLNTLTSSIFWAGYGYCLGAAAGEAFNYLINSKAGQTIFKNMVPCSQASVTCIAPRIFIDKVTAAAVVQIGAGAGAVLGGAGKLTPQDNTSTKTQKPSMNEANTNQSQKIGDTDNWFKNASTVAGMFFKWQIGDWFKAGEEKLVRFDNVGVAYAMQNARGVANARAKFYDKYKGTTNLPVGASTPTRHEAFSIINVLASGIDPVEQFIGSYDVDVNVVENNMLKFTIKNSTSLQSFTRYFLLDLVPLYEHGPGGNFYQIYTFTEPINFDLLKR